MNIPLFQVTYLRHEQHLMLPRVSSILLAQNLYDILFQYVISTEKEVKLQQFIQMLEVHIKSKAQAPFSRPLEELSFLEEGLQELKLLNWTEIPVAVFKITIQGDLNPDQEEDALDEIVRMLEGLMICKREDDLLYVYPSNLIRY